MLSAAENELMCRVGPGTVMGDLIREYWIPALAPDDMPAPDGPPLRIRLLGENLIAFRTTSGQFGLIQNACPHRGASLFFGRNEEEGLRCVYHGWKFDVTGACVDMPSEPAESNFKSKVHARAYPCVERNGIVWTYMGSRDTLPPLPAITYNLDEDCRINRFVEDCNFMQALEGDIDTVHFSFLHCGHIRPEDTVYQSCDYYAFKQRHMKSVTIEHEIGTTYGAIRPAEETTDNWRIGHFMLPFYTQAANGVLGLRASMRAWVPIDDEHTMVWGIGTAQMPDRDAVGIGGLRQSGGRNDPLGRFGPMGGRGTQPFLPETSDWIGRFRPTANMSNDYLIDRELQSAVVMDPSLPQTGTYSGVPNGAQDPLTQETMGSIYDRTQEHLGTTDGMIIRTRHKILNAAKALRDEGAAPPGVDNPSLYQLQSGGANVPKGVNAIEACWDILFNGAQLSDVGTKIQIPAAAG